jgi:mercuric ion transport protein
MGLGFLIGSAYLLPITAAFLAVSAGALGFRARRRRGYGPLWIGVLAAVLVLVGKFQLESVLTTYAGVTVLVVASIWNIWPRRMSHMSSPLTIQRKKD